MEITKNIFIFFIGALWGSFFYTLSLRFINGTMFSNPFKALFSSSKCPSCGKSIKKYLLIPLISYIVLRGKCSNCGKKISFNYTFYEIIYGVLILYTVSRYGINIYSIDIFFLLCVSIAILIVDIYTLTIPDSLIVLFFLLSIYPIIYNYSFKDNLHGFLLMFIFFALILFIFPGSFGGGDVKYAAVIGLFLGLEFSIVAIEAALISGAFIGVIYALKTGRNLKAKIPFGPFLTFGLIISLFYGREIVLSYYNLIY